MPEFKLNKNSKKISIILKYLPCFFKGAIIMFGGILVLTLTYYKISQKSDVLYYLCYLFFAFGAFVTGNSTFHKLGGRGIVSGTLGALPLMVISLSFILIFSYKTVTPFILLTIPVFMLFGAIGGIVGSNAKKRY